LKVVSAGDASEKTKNLMAAQFPKEWKVVTVRAEDLINEIKRKTSPQRFK
jgi:hypothetical protein